MRDIDKIRRALLVKFGVAPWSEEAKMLTDELCLEYADFLDTEESESTSFDVSAFQRAAENENLTVKSVEVPKTAKADTAAMSDYIERELRRRDTGFTLY